MPIGVVIGMEGVARLKYWVDARFYNKTEDEIIALNDKLAASGTPIKIYPAEITLEPGDAVFFRYDLFHAGVAYDALNIRNHFYLEVKKRQDKLITNASSGNVSTQTSYEAKLEHIFQGMSG
jgi:ectoine hydroxylase-related dioxygenase (phytanoyl-CoA dioxygenase family)